LTPIFECPVSDDNKCLAGGFWASGLCIQKFRSRWRRLGAELNQLAPRKSPVASRLRAKTEPIVSSIRMLRIVGSIPREHRAVVQLQCREANGFAVMHSYRFAF